jgi:ribosomal protein S18 acetylase RimI-like enzyme
LNEVSLRLATPDDEQFLLKLYTAGRMRELETVSWSPDEIQKFCEMQYRAQSWSYRTSYNGAEDQIIELNGEPIGRLMVFESEAEILLVDIALLPQFQNLGIGTGLIEQIKARSRQSKIPLRLHVLLTNPGIRLYQRLGFTRIADDGVYMAMEMLPETNLAIE